MVANKHYRYTAVTMSPPVTPAQASNQALAEVMAEVKGMRIGKPTSSSTAAAKGSTAAAPKPKGAASTPPKPPVKKP